MEQLSLLDVEIAYANDQRGISNKTLYNRLAELLDIPIESFAKQSPVGRSNVPVSLIKRKVRWYQQTLKQMGVLEHVEGERGVWRMTGSAKTQLRENIGAVSLVSFSTKLGVAIWGRCRDTFNGLEAPITLCLTSPPYPLRSPRAYGNPQDDNDYVDFICASLEPIIENLKDGGSLCLNISNDIFCRNSPARSFYREKLVLALHERLGLYKMDELVWRNPCKAPGPTQWASITRQQLNVEWEPIYWFTNNPQTCCSDNRRVLQPHTEAHTRFMQSDNRPRAIFSDGAYNKRPNSFSNQTPGKIPRNILEYSHNCKDQRNYKKMASTLGLPAHGAPYPLALAKFLIEYMTTINDLVVDPFAGSFTTAVAAERLGRRWLCTDNIGEYVAGSTCRFKSANGLSINPNFVNSLQR